jgi:hypothetical protein
VLLRGNREQEKSLLRRQYAPPGADEGIRTLDLPLTRRRAIGFYVG